MNLFGTDFKALAAQFFHDSALDQIFHPSEFRMAIGRRFSNVEMTYAEKLKRKYATPTQNGSVKVQNLMHGPPTKVLTKNLSYSKFSKSSDMSNVFDNPDLISLVSRLSSVAMLMSSTCTETAAVAPKRWTFSTWCLAAA